MRSRIQPPRVNDFSSVESVFGFSKRELVHQCRFQTRDDAIVAINPYFLTVYYPWRKASKQSQLVKLDRYSNAENDSEVNQQKVVDRLSYFSIANPAGYSN